MSGWLDQKVLSHRFQLAFTAVLSGLAVAGVIFTTQAIQRQIAVDDLKASIPDSDDDPRMQEVRTSNICSAKLT